MVSVASDIVSALSTASGASRAGKASPEAATSGFEALLDGAAVNAASDVATAASLATPTPVPTTQPATAPSVPQPAALAAAVAAQLDVKIAGQVPAPAAVEPTADPQPTVAADVLPLPAIVPTSVAAEVATTSVAPAVAIAKPASDIATSDAPKKDADTGETTETVDTPAQTILPPVVPAAIPLAAAVIAVQSSAAAIEKVETQATTALAVAPTSAPLAIAAAALAASTQAAPAPAKPQMKSTAANVATTDVSSADAVSTTLSPATGVTIDTTQATTTDTSSAVPQAPSAPHAKPAKAGDSDTTTVAATADHPKDAVAPAPAVAEHRTASSHVAATGAQDAAPTNAIPLVQPVHSAATANLTIVQPAAITHANAVPLNGVAVEIVANVQSGKSRFEIRLDPADLGRVDVRIDIDRHGQVTSHLSVEKPETLALLRQDAPHLQRALDDAGFKTSDNGLQFSLRDQSTPGRDQNSDTQRQPHRFIIQDDETTPVAATGRAYGQMAGLRSGVDIRI